MTTDNFSELESPAKAPQPGAASELAREIRENPAYIRDFLRILDEVVAKKPWLADGEDLMARDPAPWIMTHREEMRAWLDAVKAVVELNRLFLDLVGTARQYPDSGVSPNSR